MANVIAALDRPTLVLSHNKTLAAQLYSEFKQFFPENAVEYFVSYFDYYQPEAYIPRSDTYIEKDSSVNEEIERLRLSATSSLLTRRDVLVVASVSCIYGLGSPEDYKEHDLPVAKGQFLTRETFLARLVEMQYERNDFQLTRGKFRVRGDTIELCPAYTEDAVRVEFFGDEIDRITRFDPISGETQETLEQITIFAARHYVTPADKMRIAMGTIRAELDERIAELEKQGKLLEAQRLKMRTTFDLEMMEEMGFCNGIENYSRHTSGRPPGSRPYTLIDFFPEGFPHHHRRVARRRAADRRHVRGRPLAQDGAGRARLPAALRARQPPASTPTRKASSAARPVSSKPPVVPPATNRAASFFMPIARRIHSNARWLFHSTVANGNSPTIWSTALLRVALNAPCRPACAVTKPPNPTPSACTKRMATAKWPPCWMSLNRKCWKPPANWNLSAPLFCATRLTPSSPAQPASPSPRAPRVQARVTSKVGENHKLRL
jgi:hypothetical protein